MNGTALFFIGLLSKPTVVYNIPMDLRLPPKEKKGHRALVVALVIIILATALGVFLYWKKINPATYVKRAAQGFFMKYYFSGSALPSFAPSVNPAEKLPETNPVDVANPFKGVKTNPFE